MRIVVNDIAASKGGALTILRQFYNYIAENDTENDWVFLLCDEFIKGSDRIRIECYPKVKKSWINKVIFDKFTGRKVIESYQPDVVLSLQNIITFGVSAPQGVYIHQSIPFQNIKKFSFFKVKERSIAFIQYGIGAWIKESAKKSDHVFVQTDWMRKAVSEKAKIRLDKIEKVFPQIEFQTTKIGQFDNRRFFYPAEKMMYKNFEVIVEACNLLNAEGVYDFEVRLTLPANTIQHPNIKCIGYLDRERILIEYRSGTLLFPSYIETVGLPLLEARFIQTSIIASDTPFSHECLDTFGGARYFDPFNANELKQLMLDTLNGKIVAQKNLKKGIETHQSWDVILNWIHSIGIKSSNVC